MTRHRIIVDWPEGAFDTSDQARHFTRSALTAAAHALSLAEPVVEIFTQRSDAQEIEAHFAAKRAQRS